jgi:hypothetical protein|tara:strand:+ start:408 stop:539 length:132 start_codon:yes stop_codon:yes gene_type:complete
MGKNKALSIKFPIREIDILSIENSYISEGENKRRIKGAYELID